MELNWTTFLFEIFNFLVLLWILQHFFYKPIRAAIERRRVAMEKLATEAHDARSEAEKIRTDYEGRLEEWGREKSEARIQLEQEIEAEKARKLESLKAELDRERQKDEVLRARQMDDLTRKIENDAIAQAGQMTARLLSRFADSRLEERLVELFVADVSDLQANRGGSFGPDLDADTTFKVTSGFELSTEQRTSISAALDVLIGRDARYEFVTDDAVIAGLRVELGAQVLEANLGDGLRLFAEAGHAIE